jgi:polysaccharide biosynthesis/export protein VpsN
MDMKSNSKIRLMQWGSLALVFLWCTMQVPAETEQDHRIGPLEIIIVDVFGETNLSKEIRVQASGKINYPFLGDVEVAGKTTREVEMLLKDLLGRDYLVDPQVIVTVKEYRQRSVNVIGEVMKPGAIALPGEQKWTILDAIGQAGGLTKLAAKNKIEFTRQGRTQTFSLNELTKMMDLKKVIYLEPGDTIIVPQSIF